MKKEELEIIKKIDERILEIDFKDPIIRDFIFILNEPELDYTHIYTIKKYIMNIELKTKVKKKTIIWLYNNLTLLYKIINNDKANRIFLSLRYPRNILQLAKKIKVNRGTIRYWLDKMMRVELILPHEWSVGREKLFRRNLPERLYELSLIDNLCRNKQEKIAKEELKKRFSY